MLALFRCQTGEGATPSQQFVVTAVFDQATILEDEDLVDVANGGQAMGDDHHRAAALR